MTEFYSARTGRRVAETQAESFHSLSVSDLKHDHHRVMACFDRTDTLLTRDEIAERSSILVQTVCGRVRELLDAKRLVVRGERKEMGKKRRTTKQLLGLPKA